MAGVAVPVMAVTSAAAAATDRSEVSLYRYMQEYDNPRMSMTFSHTKGLLNAPGQNNCFLNSAVQVFWHLDVFRRNFRHLSGHACMGHSCIFCALKVIFTQFQHSDKGAQPPDPLRRALAHTFADQQRFQLGYMDDAAECFENILLRIHTHVAPDEKEDQCRAKHCIPHQKFSLAITEQVGCRCGAVSDPFSYNEMVFYVSTSALVTEAVASYQANPSSWGNFARLLKDTVAKGDTRSCPRNCGAKCEKKRILTNHPDVVSIGLVWDSAKSGADHIQDVVGCVGTTLRLQELFHNSSTPDAIKHSSVLNLVGVVCYYGKHYSTFFFHSKVEEWIYFDDASVKQVSPNWEDVVDRIVRGRHQPLLLLYMNPRSQLLSVDSAPQYTEMVPGYEWQEAAAQAAATAAVGLKSGDDSGLRASSGSLSSLPPPPPGFDGSSDGSSTASSTATPVLGGSSKRLPLQQTYSEPKATASAWAPAYPYKNGFLDPRQQDDRDSGADEGSYTDLDRQSSLVSTDDTASSYSSRASGSSSSYMGEREQYGHRSSSYGRAVSVPASSGSVAADRVKDGQSQDKVRMRKKKARAAGQGGTSTVSSSGSGGGGLSSASRCLSAVSLTSADSEDGGCKAPGRDSGLDVFPANPPGYATLPRKKKVKSIAAADELSRHVDWIKEVAKKGEQLQPAATAAASVPAAATATSAAAVECQDVRDRIRQFNGFGGTAAGAAGATVTARTPVASLHGAAAAASATAAAARSSSSIVSQKSSTVLKPTPLYGEGCSSGTTPSDDGYIDRSSVERLIRKQQRSATSASPTKERAGAATPAAAAAAVLACDLSALRVKTAGDPPTKAAIAAWHGGGAGDVLPSDTVSIGSLKDSGYRSGAGGGAGDRTSMSSAGSGSVLSAAEASSHRSCAPDYLGQSRVQPPLPACQNGGGGRPWGAALSAAAMEGHGGGSSGRGYVPVSAGGGCDIANGAGDCNDDDEDFPPPPSEQELRHIGVAGWHSKQASQGSLSSETSTLRNSGTARPDDSCGDDDVDDDCRSCSGASTSSRQLGGSGGVGVSIGRPAERPPKAGSDVCDFAAATAAVALAAEPPSRVASAGYRGAWATAAVQSEQPAPFGSAAVAASAAGASHPLLARAHSTGPAAPGGAHDRRTTADVSKSAAATAGCEKPSFQFPPRALHNVNGSAVGMQHGSGMEQPLAGDSALGKQYSPLRSPAGLAARNSSAALTREGQCPPASARATEPPTASGSMSSPSLSSQSSVAAAAGVMAGPQPACAAAAAAQPSADGRSPMAPSTAQPQWQPLPEEARSWSRPAMQRTSSCSAERAGAVQAPQPAAAARSAAPAQSHAAGAAPLSAQRLGATQPGASVSPVSASGLTAQGAAAGASATGSSAGGGPADLPLRLYGERQPAGMLAATGGRQRDSYAQSLGSAAAELYGRGSVMLPPKVRRGDTNGSSSLAAAATPLPSVQPPEQLQAAAGPGAPRSAYELGYSHYDRLPRSQQQQQLRLAHGRAELCGASAGVDSRGVDSAVATGGSGALSAAVAASAQPSPRPGGCQTAAWQQQQRPQAVLQQQRTQPDAAGRAASMPPCGAPPVTYQQARPLPQQPYGARPAAGCDQGQTAVQAASPASSSGGWQQQQQRCAQPLPCATALQQQPPTPPWQQQQQDTGREAPWQNGGVLSNPAVVGGGSSSSDSAARVTSQLPRREGGMPASAAAPPWQRPQPPPLHQSVSSRPPQPLLTSGPGVRAPPAGPAASQWDGL